MPVLDTDKLLVQAIATGRFIPWVLLAWALLFVGLLVNAKLRALDSAVLEWSPFHVKANLTLVPLRFRFIWPAYAVVLAAAMPFLALLEEVIFRAGTTTWERGLLWGAIGFGLSHLASLVSVRMVIYLMLIGAVLVIAYLMGGLLAAFVVHAVYNLTALTLIVIRRRDERFAS